MGSIGISCDDFCRLRFEEIDEILRSWAETHSNDIHDRWNRMRLQTFMMLSPFCKSLPEPEKLLRFPWEEDEDDSEEPESPLSEDERKAVFEEQKRRLGWR